MDEAFPIQRRMPWTVPTLIAIWVLTEFAIAYGTRDLRPSLGLADTIGDVLRYVYPFLIVSLVGYGLIKGLRFPWLIAFAWQALDAAYGIINLAINDYDLEAILRFTQIPFYGGGLPIAIAVISFVLLLLPPTRNWVTKDG